VVRPNRTVLLALAALSAIPTFPGEPAVCGEFKNLGWPDQRRLDPYGLVDSFTRGARESAGQIFYNIDLDGDDKGDIIEYGCSASTIPADPCFLTASLSNGGRLTFESWTMRLVRHKGLIYVVSWPHREMHEPKYDQIFLLSPTGVRKVCELRKSAA